eukprot:COSAG05_NODE_2667_length_2783_cov_7.122951_2_plen_215_part_00
MAVQATVLSHHYGRSPPRRRKWTSASALYHRLRAPRPRPHPCPYKYITDAIREETKRKQPFAAFLLCGEFEARGDMFKLQYHAGASAKVDDIQEAYDIYRADVLKTGKQTLSFKDWNEQLKMASNLLDGDKVFTLKYKIDIFLCKECGKNNTLTVLALSTCKPTCSNQCPPNAHLAPHAATFLRGRFPKIKKTSQKRDNPFVLNLRLTRTNKQK